VKHLVLMLAMACPLTVAIRPGVCQVNEPAEQKHLIAWGPDFGHGNKGILLSALNIVRGAEYPSVVYLEGNVQVKSPVCLPVGRKKALVCDGYMILHADQVEFHEDTGRIVAHGNVSVTPLEHETRRK
jgi:lipopolysaccharide assembly outer membrane protein LptD (OstA)